MTLAVKRNMITSNETPDMRQPRGTVYIELELSLDMTEIPFSASHSVDCAAHWAVLLDDMEPSTQKNLIHFSSS